MDAAICVLFSPDRRSVCLVQRQDIPVWVLPGGGIETGEEPSKAAIREMEEETGYRVSIVRKIGEYSPVNCFSKPTHLFEVEITGGSPRCSEETKDVRFFSLEKLPKLLPPPHLHWIEDAKENHPKILQKKIQGTSYWTFARLLLFHPILTSRFLLMLVKEP